jgi:HicA toxin of bacterial toxin-antitoxin,
MLAKNDCNLSINVVAAVMNSKHTKTLRAVFKSPTPGTLEWQAIESLLVAVGCDLIEGSGSRVRFSRDGIVASFHRPHPEKEAKRYQVRDARDYLKALGEEI